MASQSTTVSAAEASGPDLAGAAALIRGTGEMAGRIRAHVWRETAFGPIEQWPPELLTLVNLMLASREIMTVFWGADRLMIYNDAYITQLGDRHPMLGKPLGEVWPDVVDQVAEYIATAFSEGRSSYLDDAPVLLMDGTSHVSRFYTASFEPVWVRTGSAVSVGGVLQIAMDNTAKVHAERAREEAAVRLGIVRQAADRAHEELRSTHEKLQIAMAFAGQGSFVYDEESGNVTADQATQEFFELPGNSGPAEYWISKVHPDDQERVDQAFAEAATGKGTYDLEYRIVRSDGVHWLQARASRISMPGAPIVLTGICEDITARKHIEEHLRLIAERMHMAQSTGKIASWDWDLAVGKIFWTESEQTWGRPAEDVDSPEKCFAYIHPEDAPRLQAALEPALAGHAAYQCEFRVLWPDNTYHWTLGRGQSVFFDMTGKPTRLIGVNLDMTERKLVEAALLQNEKLAVVGRLASSIAHEINNPLESVTNLLYLAISTPDVPTEAREYLDMAGRELRRASSIVSQTLRFHKQSTASTNCSGEQLFTEVLTIYQGRITNSHIRVEERYRAAEGVDCLEGEIRQVLSNLVGNAIDAMPNGGRLLLRSRETTQMLTGHKGVTLTVADTGSGMSAAVRQRVFEAFYSTKGIGGTGLGLWISKEIVDRHHGSLRVRSSRREGASGTVFTLFLPHTR